MDLRQLEYVVAIAEEKNLIGAAEKVFISPSALSQFVNKIETELGAPLFKRVKGSWELTNIGKIYTEDAKSILAIKKQTYSKISDIIGSKTGTFSVGVNPGKGSAMFSSIYPSFHKAYPHARLKLIETSGRRLVDMVANGILDIGFVTRMYHNPNIKFRILSHEPLVVAVPDTHQTRKYLPYDKVNNSFPKIDLSVFKDQEFLLMNKGTSLRALIDGMFKKAGFEPKILFESSSMALLESMLKNGIGVSIIPLYYANKAHDVSYFFPVPSGEWEWTVIYRNDAYITGMQEHFISLAKDFFQHAGDFIFYVP